MYTTSQVAEQLQLTNKKVLLFSKKGKLNVEKSSNGTYLFTDEQMVKIKEIYEASIQPVETKQNDQTNSTHIIELNQKLEKIEEKLETKANEVVSVQILEHRREIEDLKKLVSKLGDEVLHLKESNTSLKNELEDQKKIVAFKPKKRFAILSIFGV